MWCMCAKKGKLNVYVRFFLFMSIGVGDL